MAPRWRKALDALQRFVGQTAVQLAVAGVVALVSGSTLYYRWRDVESWFGARTLVDNWRIAATWLLIGGLIVGLLVYVRKYRQQCARDHWLHPPWIIRDSAMSLEWRLRRRPESWMVEDLGTEPAVVDSLIQGPFDGRLLEDGERCLEPLTIRTNDGAIVATECSRCLRTIYDDWRGVWGLAWLKTGTLKSLRRDIENGKRVQSGYSGDFALPFIE